MKIKRLLSFLLVAVLVLGVLPLAVAAEDSRRGPVCGYDEHPEHVDACYELTCEREVHTHSEVGGSCYKRCRNILHSIFGHGSKCIKHNGKYYYLSCNKTEHTHDLRKPGECYSLVCDKEFHTHDNNCYMYNYTITLMDEDADAILDTLKGEGKLDESIPIPATVQDESGRTYIRKEGQPEKHTIDADNNEITVYYILQEEEEEEPPYIPPIYNAPSQTTVTPEPEPEIELPEEEIPTDVPEDDFEEEFDFEEEEEFEDEEIPTDVPRTGDSSPIYAALALIALAGAAFALSFKKSRNNG